eukprot:m51a1_g2292 putative sap dna-binding domain-containing protein (336) ;mRNA; r:414010-415263
MSSDDSNEAKRPEDPAPTSPSPAPAPSSSAQQQQARSDDSEPQAKRRRRSWAEQSADNAVVVTSDTLKQLAAPAKQQPGDHSSPENANEHPEQQPQQQSPAEKPAEQPQPQPHPSSSPGSSASAADGACDAAAQKEGANAGAGKTVLIEKLVRPFTLPAIKTMLAKFGEITFFWINDIKSFCYVTYATEGQAQAALSELNGKVWPEHNKSALSVTFSTEEAAHKASTGRGMPLRIVTRTPAVATVNRVAEAAKPGAAKSPDAPQQKPTDKDAKQQPPADKAKADAQQQQPQQKAGGKLDVLFRKTKAEPRLFWLPLSEDEAEKRAKARRDRERRR